MSRGMKNVITSTAGRISMVLLLAALFVAPPPAFGGDLTGTVTVRGVRSPENVVIYLGHKLPADQLQLPAENPVMDQRKLIFIPHVMCVMMGSTVDFPNNDEVPHNVFSPSPVKKFNLGTYKVGVVKQVTFDKPGLVPLLCTIHPEMSAFILVLETPYYAITGKEGTYCIKGIPAGNYKIKTWHEKLKPAVEKVDIPESGEVTLDLSLRR
jgi:plastocyanin